MSLILSDSGKEPRLFHRLGISMAICVTCISSTQAEPKYPWLDTMHDKINTTVTDTAIWADGFFANDKSQDQRATGSARIRLAWAPRTTDFSETDVRIRARVKLPNLKDRADLIFSDYDDEESEALSITPNNTQTQREDSFNLAFRFRTSEDSGFTHRLGVGRRFQLFAKSRYQNFVDFTENTQLRWETAVHYYNRDGFGADVIGTLDHSINSHNLLRSDTRFFYRDKENDWLWQQSFQHYLQLGKKSGLVMGYYSEGQNRPGFNVNEHLFGVRYRRQALREWLFFEVEPFVLWRRDENFATSYGVALRVEGFFGQPSVLF